VAGGLGWSIVPTLSLAGFGCPLLETAGSLSAKLVIGAALREKEESPEILALVRMIERFLSTRRHALAGSQSA
jgi:hypothetical protein